MNRQAVLAFALESGFFAALPGAGSGGAGLAGAGLIAGAGRAGLPVGTAEGWAA